MADYLMRGAAPLTGEEWADLDAFVVRAVERRLVGRRILPLFGPLGAGVQVAPVDALGTAAASGGAGPVQRMVRTFAELRELSQDFVLDWRDIELAHAGRLPLEFGPAGVAAAAVAWAEDQLIFRGDADAGVPGLLTVRGRVEVSMSDWIEEGAFTNITRAIRTLQENDSPGPYALVVSPVGYATMERPYANTGALEITLVRDLAADGVYQSPVLNENEALLLATGRHIADLAVGADMAVAYIAPNGMDHLFRVVETIALRVKRPAGICTLVK